MKFHPYILFTIVLRGIFNRLKWKTDGRQWNINRLLFAGQLRNSWSYIRDVSDVGCHIEIIRRDIWGVYAPSGKNPGRTPEEENAGETVKRIECEMFLRTSDLMREFEERARNTRIVPISRLRVFDVFPRNTRKYIGKRCCGANSPESMIFSRWLPSFSKLFPGYSLRKRAGSKMSE